MDTPSKDISQLLASWSQGDQAAFDQLLPIVYEELRRLAKSYFRREPLDHTLQATALVHEAYLRLIDQKKVNWQNRAHFFGIAALMMRRILVDHANGKNASKRGGGAIKMALDEAFLDEAINFAEQRDVDLIALDDALKDLEALDLRQSRIVELRFFAGLSIEETAEVIDVSPATVKREWRTAKLWLQREISKRR